jgi:hypothetical protein
VERGGRLQQRVDAGGADELERLPRVQLHPSPA